MQACVCEGASSRSVRSAGTSTFRSIPIRCPPIPSASLETSSSRRATSSLTPAFRLKGDREQGWRDFQGWRVNYDRPVIGLAGMVMAPYAPWSSDRSLRLPPTATALARLIPALQNSQVSGRVGAASRRMYHSVSNARRNASGGMARKNDSAGIWLAWAAMAARLRSITVDDVDRGRDLRGGDADLHGLRIRNLDTLGYLRLHLVQDTHEVVAVHRRCVQARGADESRGATGDLMHLDVIRVAISAALVVGGQYLRLFLTEDVGQACRRLRRHRPTRRSREAGWSASAIPESP